jgi:peptide subunit release factor RF-3
LKNAKLPSNAKLVEDYTGRPVALFESEWSVRLAREWNPNLRFEPFGMRHDTEALAS